MPALGAGGGGVRRSEDAPPSPQGRSPAQGEEGTSSSARPAVRGNCASSWEARPCPPCLGRLDPNHSGRGGATPPQAREPTPSAKAGVRFGGPRPRPPRPPPAPGAPGPGAGEGAGRRTATGPRRGAPSGRRRPPPAARPPPPLSPARAGAAAAHSLWPPPAPPPSWPPASPAPGAPSRRVT